MHLKTNFNCKKYDCMPPTRGMDVGIIWLMQCSYYQPHIVLLWLIVSLKSNKMVERIALLKAGGTFGKLRALTARLIQRTLNAHPKEQEIPRPRQSNNSSHMTNDEPLSSKLAVVEEAVAIIVDRFTDCQSL